MSAETRFGPVCGRCGRPERLHCPACSTCATEGRCVLGCLDDDPATLRAVEQAIAAWEDGHQRAALALIDTVRQEVRSRRTPVTVPHPLTGGVFVTTLCGSMRFYRQILAVAAELTAEGVVALAPFATRTVGTAVRDAVAVELDTQLHRLHRAKIDMSDSVIVVSDESGYHGTSTATEIAHAARMGVPVTYRRLSDAETDLLLPRNRGGA